MSPLNGTSIESTKEDVASFHKGIIHQKEKNRGKELMQKGGRKLNGGDAKPFLIGEGSNAQIKVTNDAIANNEEVLMSCRQPGALLAETVTKAIGTKPNFLYKAKINFPVPEKKEMFNLCK
eukprot:11786639-Ditylum_brightwellii.AAC.1